MRDKGYIIGTTIKVQHSSVDLQMLRIMADQEHAVEPQIPVVLPALPAYGEENAASQPAEPPRPANAEEVIYFPWL